MKDSLLASGKSEDDLKRIIDAYKKASDSDIAAAGGSFESFAASVLAAPSTSTSTSTPAAKTPKTPDAPSKPSKNKKKAEKGRISWTAAEKKVFKEVIESSGGLVTPELTLTFTTYINDLSPEAFDSLALSGHMRAWISSSSSSSPEPRAGAGLMTPTEYDLARSIENKDKDENENELEDEDEDLLEIDHNGETLLIGENSGKIFVPSPQEGMPDVMVGIAGQGKYKAVKKPSA